MRNDSDIICGYNETDILLSITFPENRVVLQYNVDKSSRAQIGHRWQYYRDVCALHAGKLRLQAVTLNM